MGKTLDQIVAAVDEPTAQAIAKAVSRLTSRGLIREGDRLPTVRELGAALGVSPTTVADAWRILANRGLIVTRRRGGTVSAGVPQHLVGSTFYAEKDALTPRGFRFNLTSGSPDPALLPDLAPFLAEVAANYVPMGYQSREILPELEAALRETWPFEAPHLALAHGSADALERVIHATVQFGDRVLVERYAFPPLLEVLRGAGAELIPVDLDDQGMVPESLSTGLAAEPVAVFLTPRAQNPTGVDMSRERCEELADILDPHQAIVIEDDYLSAASDAPLHSLGTQLGNRVLHIRGFSKAYGPDLRVGAISGPEELLGRILRRQRLGPGWVSAIVQGVLARLLDSDEAKLTVDAAATAYRQRRESLLTRLKQAGVAMEPGGSGYHLWIPVRNEGDALLTLATYGIAVSRGSSFCTSPPTRTGAGHIRVTVSEEQIHADELASLLAGAAQTSGITHAAQR